MTDVKFITLEPDSARAKYQSDVAIIGNWGMISGIRPVDLNDDRIAVPDGLERQIKKTLDNLDQILTSLGMTKANIVSVQISLIEFDRFFERMNVVYQRYFVDHKPLRTCSGVVALTRGVLIEISCMLYKPD